MTRNSTPEAKITLFRSLFRGRDDVYPLRFESRKSGKSGYQPACDNEWVRGICEKPRIKCLECPHQRFPSVSEQAIRWHLSGKNDQGKPFVMGVYPMLRDETCFFLAADFDRESWKEDAQAFLETSRKLGIPSYLERSRSGNGGHVWIFFQEAIPAGVARRLGSHILTETMENRPEVGLRSYDRFFPNQDTLPQGGLGNLIALPLQKRAREAGNSVFLDDNFNPHPDQWEFLGTVSRLSRSKVETVVSRAEGAGRIVGVRFALADEDDDSPWSAPPSRHRKDLPIHGELPKNLEMVISDQIYIPKEALPPPLRNRLIRLAAFQNPDFYKSQAMRLPTYDKPRIISCAEDHPKHLALPRGCLDEVQDLFKGLKIRVHLRNERCPGVPINVSFSGTLRPEQNAAAQAILANDTGVLAATTAFGKTVLAAWLIAKRGVNTLVMVHRQQLMEQWVERLSSFLGVPTKEIGRLGGGRKKLTGKLDVAIIQSLIRKGTVDDRIEGYGHLIVDECHHLAAHSFESVARRSKAKFVLGLSATVARKDGHHPIIMMQCGPIRFRADAREQAKQRPFIHQVFVRPTGFRMSEVLASEARLPFHKLYGELINDPARNRMICEDVLSAVAAGRTPLLLTERTEHLDCFVSELASKVAHVIALKGGMGKKELRGSLGRLLKIPANEGRVVIATGGFIGEGFDDSRLDTLFLALPVSWRGTIAQYVGRLHRLHDGKTEVRVYDYADLNVAVLSRMFDRRCIGYEAVGYRILLPASAVPGWPPEVPLPVDPEWNRNYAASVRRLIRDGVDQNLANLFVFAAREPSPGSEGIDRARSASEAFLYRRLETLLQTVTRFKLNQKIPIPFDGWSEMEVDLLDSQHKLAIELDGDQHLGDADAYRRDRRKDALLQQHGYFVHRFLASDLGKRLDYVLDSILSTLVHLENECREINKS